MQIATIRSSALLFHELDATMMNLTWNLGAAALITALGGVFGQRMFLWWSGGSS
jgi:hypothetical protein